MCPPVLVKIPTVGPVWPLALPLCKAEFCLGDQVLAAPRFDSPLYLDEAIGGSTSALTALELSPKTPSPRRVQWTDHETASPLSACRDFFRDDEAWRASHAHHGPLLHVVGPATVASSLEAVLPASTGAMMEALMARCVQLESTAVRDRVAFLTIRVLNRAFDKHVVVRCTTNNWASFSDVPAVHCSGGDNLSDRFVATVVLPEREDVQLQFAVCYEVAGCTYWDNNSGRNYTLTVHTSRPAPSQSSARRILRTVSEPI